MATDSMSITCSFAHDGEGRLVYEEWSVWVVGTESGLDVVEMSGYGAAAAYVRAWCGLEGPFPVEYGNVGRRESDEPRNPRVPPETLGFVRLG